MSALSDRINAKLKERRMTRYALAKATGLNMSTVYLICSGKRDPKASTVERIEKALA